MPHNDSQVVTNPIDVAGDHLNAECFLSEHGANVRWSPELGRWFVWNGAWWEEDRLERVQGLANQTVAGLREWVSSATNHDEWRKRARHYENSTRSGRRDGMLTVARPEVAVAVSRLDLRPDLLACRNGTVNLRTGVLAPGNPDHYITRGIGHNYDPEARSDSWQHFLRDIFAGDTALIAYVQRLAGYAITGETKEHILADLYGTGANGKSTFVGSIMRVMGEYSAAASEGLLLESRYEQHPERVAMLRGRRLVLSSELERRAVLAEGLVKALTGGDRLSARELYGRRFEFEPTHKLVLVTNHLPRVRGTDEAIWRRIKVVPFKVTIPPEQRISDLAYTLATSHSQAILAWLVAGAVEYYRNGLGDARRCEKPRTPIARLRTSSLSS